MDRTARPHEVCEMALAHTIPNAAEAAYRRGDLFEKRAALMTAWADFLATPPQTAEIVPQERGIGVIRNPPTKHRMAPADCGSTTADVTYRLQ
jgi:hypothetical protein